MGLMLPSAPQFSLYQTNWAATPNASPGTAVTHGATPHTKAAWVQLIASTSFAASFVVITVAGNNASGAASGTLLDIGIGAASSEQVIIPNLAAGYVGTMAQASGVRSYMFPLYIPSGVRIAARTQSVRTTGNVVVGIQLYGGPRDPAAWWAGTQVTTYGANTANSSGTKFTPGNSGAEGTGVLVGTTTASHECLVVGIQGHPDDVTYGANIVYHFDIGLGSSSTTWIAQDRYSAIGNAAEYIGHGGHIWWPIFDTIPSGSEVMIRGEASGTADALSAIIHGVS